MKKAKRYSKFWVVFLDFAFMIMIFLLAANLIEINF